MRGRYVRVVALFAVTAAMTLSIVYNQTAVAEVTGVNMLADYGSGGYSSGGTNGVAHLSDDGSVLVWSSSRHDVIVGDPYSSSTVNSIYKRDFKSGVTSYVTVNQSGTPIDINQDDFAVSRTGRYVAFSSASTDIVSLPLVPSNPTQHHVYLRDTLLGTTTLVDKNDSGELANVGYGSGAPSAVNVSDDGRFVLFKSQATNLLSVGNPGIPNSTMHFYVKDLQTGEVINPATSDAGVRANGYVTRALSSCDGSLIAFTSNSTNLTPQDDGQENVYLKDIRNGQSIKNLTSSANNGVGIQSISCNGRYIVMNSFATNITPDVVSGSNYHYFRYDRLSDAYELIDKSSSGYISSSVNPGSGVGRAMRTVSDTGLVLFISNDRNMVAPSASNDYEIYLRDPSEGVTELVPVNSSGIEQSPALTASPKTIEISAMGNVVIYTSRASNLIPGVTTTGYKIVLSKLQ